MDLFEALQASGDKLYPVEDVYDLGEGSTLQRKLNIFARYVKEKSVLYRLQYENFLEENENESYRIHRFRLRCLRSDFQYASLLKAICKQNMSLNLNYSWWNPNDLFGLHFTLVNH